VLQLIDDARSSIPPQRIVFKITTTMITTIIFDYGGVLGTDSDIPFNDVLALHGVSKWKAMAIWERHWHKLKLGEESVTEIWKDASRECNISIHILEKEYEKKVHANPHMILLAQRLKRNGYKIGILANEAEEWMDIKRKKGKLTALFDVVHGSADLRLAKPNAKAYTLTLKALHSRSEETVFIDNLTRNTSGAKRLGMQTIYFRDIVQLKKRLKAMGIRT
jgi:putative hydrolase of the HAD superfamily